MRTTILALFALFAHTFLHANECVTAFNADIICGDTTIYTGSTLGGTPQTVGFCGTSQGSGGADWYLITGDGGNITAETTLNSNYDTKIWVFSGACGSLVCVGGDDDGGAGTRSKLTFPTVAGTDYYVVVGGFGGSEGNYELELSTDFTGCGEECSSAIAYNLACSDSVRIAGSTLGGTPQTFGFCGTGAGVGGANWYSITGDGNDFTANTFGAGTNYDTRLWVFEGSCGSLNCITGNDDALGLRSEVNFSTVNGNTYYIVVGGFGASEGNYDLYIENEGVCINDECSLAQELTIDCSQNATVFDSTNGLSAPTFGFCGTGPGTGGVRWYKFTSIGGNHSASTVSPNTNFDTKIWAFTGSCSGLICVAGNDDFGSLQSRIDFLTNPGQEYYIAVGGFGSSEGEFELNVTKSDLVGCNQECNTALNMNVPCGGTASESGSTIGSTTNNAPSCLLSPGTGGANWYKFTSTGGSYTASTSNGITTFDTKLFVYDGSCGTLNCIAANDDGGVGTTSLVTFSTTPGTEYYIVVDGFASAAGDYQLDITSNETACGDVCTDAIPIVFDASGCSDSLSTAGSTVGGTPFSVPFCGTGSGTGGVKWFSISGNDSYVSVNTISAGTNFDTKLWVFDGSCGALTCVGGNDDSGGLQSQVDFFASSGTNYYVIVGGFGAAEGRFDLNASFSKNTSNFINASVCDSYTAPSGTVFTSSGTYTDIIPNSLGCDSVITINLTILNSNSGSESVIACDNYLWAANGTNYTSSGTYTATLTNQAGCDSVATLNLTINNSNSGSENITVCDSYTWPANGQSYTSSGTYTTTLSNAAGCDSVATLNLTINDSNSGSESVSACDSYTWAANGQTYTNSGTYTETLSNAAGCDSIATLNLTINNSNSGSESITACDSYTWPANGQSYTSSGTYTATLTNVNGCDSVATLNLTINNSNTGSENVTACDTYTWAANGQSYTSSGTYTTTLSNSNGCDSVLTLNLTINNSNSGSESVSACDSYTWAANGQTYTSSGTYTETLSNAAGCDSTATLNLTINNSNSGSEAITACDSYTWAANGQTYTSGGTYTATLTNVNGCDSIATLNLTINNSSTGSEAITACDSYTWPANGQTYTSGGNYTATLTASNGCDSVVTLNLTINNSSSSSVNVTACDTYTWPSNGQTYTSGGVYTNTLTASNGCDSIVTLNLTINNSNTGLETISACDSYTWPANGQTYNTGGSYTTTLTNAAGCDSVVTLNLTINSSNTGSENVTACDTYTWPANGQTYNTGGTYTATLSNAAGCDSVVTLNLTLNSSSTGSETITACDTFTWTANGQTYTAGGTYTATLTNAAGCDSVVTLNLTINNSSSTTISEDICAGDVYVFGTQTLNTSGTYTEVFNAQNGCDSTVTLNLTVIDLDTTVNISGATLTSNASGANYQWIDCDNGNVAIAGETNQSFTATQSGSYAVVVSDGICRDTSDCINVIVNGITSKVNLDDILIYPNPATKSISIRNLSGEAVYEVSIYSIGGFLIRNISNYNTSTSKAINIENLASGAYVIELKNSTGVSRTQFIKD